MLPRSAMDAVFVFHEIDHVSLIEERGPAFARHALF
jgi:hypothetical protein